MLPETFAYLKHIQLYLSLNYSNQNNYSFDVQILAKELVTLAASENLALSYPKLLLTMDGLLNHMTIRNYLSNSWEELGETL